MAGKARASRLRDQICVAIIAAMARPHSDSPTFPAVAPSGPDDRLERALLARVGGPVAGLDEAGRGPLAGPVVAAAVVFDPGQIPAGLNDSKKLTERARERLFDEICAAAHVGIGVASVARIDRMNIRAASLWAMAQALGALTVEAAGALVDGDSVPPALPCPGEAIVKGDSRSVSIAAASIVAKVTRDRAMVRLAEAFPGYGFERHKGYGTKSHKEALASLGPSPLHRTSFAPVRALLISQEDEGLVRPATLPN